MNNVFYEAGQFRGLLAAVLAVVCVGRGSAQEIDLPGALRDLRAGQEKLARLEQQAATWESVSNATTNGKALSTVTTLVKRNSTNILAASPRGIIICRNDGAVFSVQKSKGTGSWVLLKHVRSDPDAVWRKMADKDFPDYYPLQAQRGEFTTLQMLDDTEFKPRRARRVSADRVELDYSYRLPAGEQGARTQVEGTLTLATDMEWVVVKSVSHAAETPAGFPINSLVVREVKRVGDTIRAKSVSVDFINGQTKQAINTKKYTYKYLPPETVDPAEFTIEYYNLTAPEFDVYEDRQFNWPLWGGIGVGCIAMSVLLAWFIRRRLRRRT